MPERVSLIRSIFADFIERNSLDTLMAHVAEDVTLRNSAGGAAPFGGDFHGKEGILDYFAKAGAVLEPHSVRALHYLEGDERVAVIGDEVLRIKSTGSEFPSDWCTVFTFRGDRIAGILVIEDHSPVAAMARLRAPGAA